MKIKIQEIAEVVVDVGDLATESIDAMVDASEFSVWAENGVEITERTWEEVSKKIKQ